MDKIDKIKKTGTFDSGIHRYYQHRIQGDTRSLIFVWQKTKHDMNMFTTTTSIYHIKLMENNAEAVVVVTVVRTIVVPIRDSTVLSVVVPATAAKHAVRAFLLMPLSPFPSTLWNMISKYRKAMALYGRNNHFQTNIHHLINLNNFCFF